MQFFIDWTWGDIALDEVGPGMFSWFHILSLVLMVLMTIVVCKLFATKHNASTDRKVVGVFALILVACELFKQQFWFVYYEYYRWEIFPFQFCSVPIYISVFATLVPSDRVREVCYRFLAFFGIIGGIAVMAVPTAVLYTYFVPMSIHSMVWHSVLISMGVYLIVSRRYGQKLKELLTPFYMYLGFIVLALIGNVLVYKLHLGTDACQPGDNLSMFFLSPYYPTQFPLLGAVQEFCYPLFVLTYIAIFTGLSLLVWKVANIAWKRVKAKA